MTFGSLFAGIVGFDLGFERAGLTCKWQVEIDPFCQRVLAKHWPHVQRFDDVRECCAGRLRRSRDDARCAECGRRHCLPWVDVLCGGFPCQDISLAGAGAGLAGARSGLWEDYARLVRDLRPRYVVVENVSALRGRGLGRVLGDLAACGYDAEWDCLPASAFGATHQRDRLWLVAYSDANGWRTSRQGPPQSRSTTRLIAGSSEVAHADGGRCRSRRARRSDRVGARLREQALPLSAPSLADANGAGRLEQWRAFPARSELATAECRDWWRAEPDVGRVAHGVPARVDRLRGLGNAIVPQIAEWIGRRLMEAV
jgi:DNA (cytosine-5)-methyltransferase 1